MKEWAEAQPPAFREGAMNMYRAQAAAYKAPATITPKRKRRVDRGEPREEKDHEEGENNSVAISDHDKDDPPPFGTRTKKRTRKTVTPVKGPRKSKQGPPSAGAMLREVEKGQQAEADLIADLLM